MNSLTVFAFNSQEIRVVIIDGAPWFVAKDVCDVLDLGDVSKACSRLKDYEKGTNSIRTLGGNQDMSIISESGLYRLVMTSRKPQAEAFQDWVVQEVIPSIRKTGGYQLPSTSTNIDLDLDLTEEQIAKHYRMFIEQARINKQHARQIAEAKDIAVSASEVAKAAAAKVEIMSTRVETIRTSLECLREFSVAQPEGLEKSLANQINQAFQALGSILQEAEIFGAPLCYQRPWRDLGLALRNSTEAYDLNARYANALRKHQSEVEQWEANGKPKGKKPQKPTRVTVLEKDNKLPAAFAGAQQVVRDYLLRVSSGSK